MRKSDLLLENLHKDEFSEHTPKNNTRRYLNVAIVLIFALLGAVVALSFMQFAGTTSNSSDPAQQKILTSTHLCGTCHMNPDNDGDYVQCESCGFDSSQPKTLKCPSGYGNMLVLKAKEGYSENAEIAGKVYKHCKETMEEGGSNCDVNVLELIPDLYDNKFDGGREPRPPHHPPRPLPEPRGFGPGPMDDFDPFMDFPMIFDILPFFDDETVNEPPVGPNGEAVTNEVNEHNEEAIAALINAPEIQSLRDLFESLPAMDETNPEHIKLTKTLMKCMQPGGSVIRKPLCADGSEPLKCKETPDAEGCLKKAQDKADNKAAGIKKKLAPVCADGSYAECDTANGFQGFRKAKKCYPNNGEGKEMKPVCLDGSKPGKCVDGSTEAQCVKGKKFFCAGSDKKPKCPEGYSTGPCKDTVTGERGKAKCPEGTQRIKCKKDENSSNPVCTSETGDRIWNTMCDNGEQPSCQDGSEYALIPFLKKVQFSRPGDAEEMMWDSSSAEEEEVFLSSANAKGRRGPRRGPRGRGGKKERARCEDQSKPGCWDSTGVRNKEVVVCKDDTVAEGFVPFEPLDKCPRRLRRCAYDGTSMVKPTCQDGSDIILPPKRELKCVDGSEVTCVAGSTLSCYGGEEPTSTDFSGCESKPMCTDDTTGEYVKPVCENGEEAVNLEKRSECGFGNFPAACYDFAEDGTATFVNTGSCPKGFEETKAKSSVCSKGEAQLRTKLCDNTEAEVICETGKPPKRHKKFLFPSWTEQTPTEQETVANLVLSRGGPHHGHPHGPPEGMIGGPNAETLEGRPVMPPGRPTPPQHGRPPFPRDHHRPDRRDSRNQVVIDFMCLKVNLN